MRIMLVVKGEGGGGRGTPAALDIAWLVQTTLDLPVSGARPGPRWTAVVMAGEVTARILTVRDEFVKHDTNRTGGNEQFRDYVTPVCWRYACCIQMIDESHVGRQGRPREAPGSPGKPRRPREALGSAGRHVGAPS